MNEAMLDEIEKLQYIRPGFVYLIRCGNSDFYKIGKATNVKSRRDNLQIGCPYYLQVVATLETSNPQYLEKRLHKRFEAKRTYGEWFKLTLAEVEEFKND
jgi:hypothetical protein